MEHGIFAGSGTGIYDCGVDGIIETKDKQVPFGNALTETKMGVVLRIRSDDEITKLLYYNRSDALTSPECAVTDAIRRDTYNQDSANKKLYLSNFDLGAAEDVRSQVNIAFNEIQSTLASTVKTPVLSVMVVVSSPINVLADGMSLRHEMLFQKINDAIEGYHVGRLGVVKFLRAEEAVTEGNTHVVYSAKYEVGELRN